MFQEVWLSLSPGSPDCVLPGLKSQERFSHEMAELTNNIMPYKSVFVSKQNIISILTVPKGFPDFLYQTEIILLLIKKECLLYLCIRQLTNAQYY